MTGFNSQIGMNFIRRYDQNGDGLSKQEIQQGQMNSYFNMMSSMATGNASGLQAAMQDLQFASVAGKNFDILSQAAKTTPFGDNNANTISPLDLMKTASNDGNRGNLTPQDVKSQYRQNAQAQNQNQNPMMQMMMQMMQMFMQMMQQMTGQGNQNQPAYNNGLQDTGNNYGLPSNFQLPNTNMNSSSAMAGLYNDGMMNCHSNYNFSGVASGQYGQQESILETLGGLPGGLMEGLGQGIYGLGDWVQGGFDKVGEFLGKVPVIGGLLEGGTKIAGALFTAPTKIAGKVIEGVGGVVKDVGKSIGKVLSKL